MAQTVDIFSIVVSDLTAATMLVMVMLSCRWNLGKNDLEHRMLNATIVFALVACFLDPLGFAFDGQPGFGAHIIVYVTNFILYCANPVMTLCWLVFLLQHLFGFVSSRQKAFIGAFTGICVVALLANFFVPVVFFVDDANVYHRGPLYVLFVVLQAAAFVDSMLAYVLARRDSGTLRFFPVHLVVIPCILGAVIQIANFGVSTLWPFIAISVAAVMISLQNELIFRDHLTGLYNRAFLDSTLQRKLEEAGSSFAGVMIDVNGFKDLNDRLGHAEGDAALVEVADLLRRMVGSQGVAVRYAGDEFVVMLNLKDDADVEEFVQRVKENVVALGENRNKPWALSVSAGWCRMDITSHDANELFDIMDRCMYADKRAYYHGRSFATEA